jgi:hypothetical protein
MKTKYTGNEMEEIKKIVDIMVEITTHYKYYDTLTIEKFNDICQKFKLP